MKKMLFMIMGVLAAVQLCAAAGTVKVPSANVRFKPDVSSVIIGKLKAGDKVEIHSGDGQWLKITAPQVFIAKSLVKDGKPRQGARLRAGAGMNFPILASVQTGMTLKEKEGSTDEWLCVEPPGNVYGYIAASLVETDGKFAKEKMPAATSVDAKPFADMAVKPGSGRQVTEEGMLYPLPEAAGNVRFALLKVVGDKYVIHCYVHTGGSDRLRFFANKQVKLIGASYEVPGWKKRVMKVKKIIPIAEQ